MGKTDKRWRRRVHARGGGGIIRQQANSGVSSPVYNATISGRTAHDRAALSSGEASPPVDSPPVDVQVNPDVDLTKPQTYARPSMTKWARRRRWLVAMWRRRNEAPAWIRGALAAAYGARPWRERTPDELYAIEERKRREREKRIYMMDALRWWDTISNTLARMGYRYKPREEGRREHKVSFDLVLLQPEAIYYRIDTAHLPYGVSSYDLVKDERVVSELLISLRRRVQAKWRDSIGAWFIVERSIGMHGIPNRVAYSAALDNIPKTAGPLVVPMGVTINARMVYQDIARMPHALIAGTTGGGKSTLLNVWLVTLLRRNRASELRLILVDLKGGVELSHYRDVPHLGVGGLDNSGIITELSDVVPSLQRVVAIMQDRARTIADAGYSDIVDYNVRAKPARRMPRILVVIDELAAMMVPDLVTGKTIKSEAMRYLGHIGNQGRAFGVHLIAATQNPNRQVVDTGIKAILNAKCAFYCSTGTASQVILGTWEAFQRLNKHPGRYIYQSGAENIEIQGPWLAPSTRNEIIAAIRNGDDDYRIQGAHDVTRQEIMEWALLQNNGYLPERRIYERYAYRGLTRAELRDWLSEMEGQRYRVLSDWYEVRPSAGTRPRMLQRVDKAGS